MDWVGLIVGLFFIVWSFLVDMSGTVSNDHDEEKEVPGSNPGATTLNAHLIDLDSATETSPAEEQNVQASGPFPPESTRKRKHSKRRKVSVAGICPSIH